MAKKGMARPDWTKLHPKNDFSPVPQIQGNAKSGYHKHAKHGPSQTDGPRVAVASFCVFTGVH